MLIEEALNYATTEIIWSIDEHEDQAASAQQAVEAIDKLRAEIVRRWLS